MRRRLVEGGMAVRRSGGTRLIVAAMLLTALPPDRLSALQCPDGSPPPCRAQPARTTPAPAPNSVAVLYFDNLSPDTADAYLADGLTEELISHLGQLDRLTIASRYAVRRHRGAVPEPQLLTRALGVAHLLTGSVRRAGRRLRVTVELVRASSGERVWGQQYDREDTDLLDVQEDIARAVASTIAGRLLPLAPDLVAEVLSPDDRAAEVLAKVADWLDAGTKLVWVVDPRRAEIRVHRADGTSRCCARTTRSMARMCFLASAAR